MVEGTQGSHHKEGSRKMSESSTVCAGIDTGKSKLDVAIDGNGETLVVANDHDGHAALALWLRRHGVERVGIEASGGYEAAVVAQLRREGFVVIMFQPAQVRAYARFQLQRAKNDKIDAALIAACTAATKTVRPPPDPRLAPLAAQLTLIEQLTEDRARLKTRRASCHGAAQQFWPAEIARLKGLVRHELALLVAAIRQHRDLAERLDLIDSVAGVGLRTAVAILLRMPEIGRVSREEAAAIAGLAPYDDDSGRRSGARHIAGGRTRLRGALYAAALPAAFRWNAQLVAIYRRLTAKGKSHKVALIACARKLIIYVNAVVARAIPWEAPDRAGPKLTVS
jgi:transposase